MRTCKLPDCDKKHFGLGYCQSHRRRFVLYGDPEFSLRDRIDGTTKERFLKRFTRSAGCWSWDGPKYPNGYGELWSSEKGGSILAHRFSYEFYTGPIPDGMMLDHMCYNRACVNPEHLRPVTNKQNVENMSVVRTDNSYGIRGVGLNKRTGKYRARVQHNGREYYGGEFDTPEEAGLAAQNLRNSLFTHNDLDRKPARST